MFSWHAEGDEPEEDSDEEEEEEGSDEEGEEAAGGSKWIRLVSPLHALSALEAVVIEDAIWPPPMAAALRVPQLQLRIMRVEGQLQRAPRLSSAAASRNYCAARSLAAQELLGPPCPSLCAAHPNSPMLPLHAPCCAVLRCAAWPADELPGE